MTKWPDDNDRIDAAIDAVARHMTAGAPGADLRVRVIARIRERRPVWRSPWVLSPLALAPKLRDALLLAQSGEHTYEEISVMLNAPVGTIKWRVSEARRVIRKHLHECGYDHVARR